MLLYPAGNSVIKCLSKQLIQFEMLQSGFYGSIETFVSRGGSFTLLSKTKPETHNMNIQSFWWCVPCWQQQDAKESFWLHKELPEKGISKSRVNIKVHMTKFIGKIHSLMVKVHQKKGNKNPTSIGTKPNSTQKLSVQRLRERRRVRTGKCEYSKG